MIKDIPQVHSAPIAQLRLTHFMGLMTYTKDQWTAFFTQEYPAPIWSRSTAGSSSC